MNDRWKPIVAVLLAALTLHLFVTWWQGRARVPLDAPPAGLARAALENPRFAWSTRSRPFLRVHFLKGSYPGARADSLVALVEQARADGIARLQGAPNRHTIDVFFVESRPQIEELVGMRATGFADVDGHGVFLVNNADWRSFERHELMHVLAWDAWGPPAAPADWISEGWAQAADGRCSAYSIDEVEATFLEAQPPIPFDSLFAHFRALPDLRAYLQATSLVGYIERTYGTNAVHEIWAHGAARIPEIVGAPLERLEREWRASLPPRPPGMSDEEVVRIWSKGCG